LGVSGYGVTGPSVGYSGYTAGVTGPLVVWFG
jgi:hypothetical protein